MRARTLRLVVGLAIVAVGAILVMSPIAVADALGKPHDTPTRMINLRASWGGTLMGLGAFVAWLPAWSPSPHPLASLYGQFFIDDVEQHPYAILGAKGVLEHLSIRCADDVADGVLATIESSTEAVTFFRHHGVLDLDHVREGDRNLERLPPAKRPQVLLGAYFTSGIYRSLVHQALS